MPKERAIQWFSAARFVVTFFPAWMALDNVLDIVLGNNAEGIVWDIRDGFFAGAFALLALLWNRKLKRAIQAVK